MVFSFLKKPEKPDAQAQKEIDEKTAKDWLPIKDVRDGIVHMKDDEYVKIVEVIPINFKLKSKHERKMLVIGYRAFLKACKFPLQISVQCRKANVEPHINRMKKFLNTEKNQNVKNMINGYIDLVTTIGSKGAITRRYFLVVPYIKPPSVKTIEYGDVIKQLNEKTTSIKDYLLKCGNEVVVRNDIEFSVDVLYSYLNKRTCEVQKLGKKLVSLMGTFLESSDDKKGV